MSESALVWFWLVTIALLALGGLMLLAGHRSVERRIDALGLTQAKTTDDLSKTTEEARRAHLRIDNHQRQITALGKELGWVDDKSHTRVLTGRLPPPPQLPSFEPLSEDEEP